MTGWLARRRKARQTEPVGVTAVEDRDARIAQFQRRIDVQEDLRWRDRLRPEERCTVCDGLGYRYFGGDSESGPAERVPCGDCGASGRAH